MNSPLNSYLDIHWILDFKYIIMNKISSYSNTRTDNITIFHLKHIVPRTYPMTSGGRRGAITDLLTTSRHPFRSFDTLRDSAARRQVQSLILSSHRFLWPPLLLPPLTVPCMIVFERPEDLETWPYHWTHTLDPNRFNISLHFMSNPGDFVVIASRNKARPLL